MKATILSPNLTLMVLFILFSASNYAQHNRGEGINGQTGKKESFCMVPLGDAYTISGLTIVKVDSTYYGINHYIRFSSSKFEISQDCPLVMILENGNRVTLEILNAEKIRNTFGDVFWGGAMAASDKEVKCMYEVSEDDVVALCESPFLKGRQYFHSDKKLNGSATDEYGHYFTLDKTKAKEKKLFIENLKRLLNR